MHSIWGDTVCASRTCVTQLEVLPLISSLVCYHLLFKLRFSFLSVLPIVEEASRCQSDRKPTIKTHQPRLSLAQILHLPCNFLVGRGLPVEKFFGEDMC